MVDWHRQTGSPSTPMTPMTDNEAHPDHEAGGVMDILTHPWMRELLLLLFTSLDSASSWVAAADLVREMVRQDGVLILTDLFWYGLSVLVGRGEGAGLATGPEGSLTDAHSEVTVECDEDDDDAMQHSLFSVVLRLLEAMTRFTPAAAQALLHCQALPKLVASFWILAGYGPGDPTYHDDLAVAGLVRLLDRCLQLSPDIRPTLLEAGIIPYMLAASLTPTGEGLMLVDTVRFLKRHHIVRAATNGKGQQASASVLAPYLPVQMIRVVSEEKPETTVRIFNSSVKCPDVIWGPSQRVACFAHVDRVLAPSTAHVVDHPYDWPVPPAGPSPGDDPYDDLSSLWQVNGIYLEQLLLCGPESFVRTLAPQDFLCQLLSPMTRLLKIRSNSLSSTPAATPTNLASSALERLPPEPLVRAHLLLQSVQRIATLWPLHPNIWESIGVPTVCALMDWTLTSSDRQVRIAAHATPLVSDPDRKPEPVLAICRSPSP